MLRYSEFGLSHMEVPGENSICIYISGCTNACPDCHYPELCRPDYGDALYQYFEMMLDLYSSQATCVTFMGEGKAGEAEKRELLMYAGISAKRGLKTCLYSGRNTDIEYWMNEFDYVKVGSYISELGGLDSPTTNQRMYMKVDDSFVDITAKFQNGILGQRLEYLRGE